MRNSQVQELRQVAKALHERHRGFPWEFDATANRLELSEPERNMLGAIVALAYTAASDEGKQRDLFEPGDAAHRDAIRELRAYREILIDGYRPPEKVLRLPPEDKKRRLRALGYIE